jgi:hypothetical protein
MKKIKFIKDWNPRKKDEVIETDNKIADWYIANGLATEGCGCDENKEDKCTDCEEHAKSKQVVKEELIKEEEPKKRARKKKVDE